MLFQFGKAASYSNTQFLMHTVSTANLNQVYYVVNTTNSGNVTIPVQYTDWVHYSLTYNGTTVSFYVNGNLVKTQTITTAKLAGTRLSIGTYYNAGTNLNGMIQDFRLYDTCLDAKQIKDISKGLIVHYTLSRPGNENMLFASATLTTNRWIFSTRATNDGVDTDGFAVAKLTGSTADWGAAIHMNYNGTGNTIPYADVRNKTVTLSFWMKASKSITYSPICFSLRTASSSSRTKLGWIGSVSLTTSWQKFVRTVNVTDSFFSSGSGTISTTDYMFIQCYNHNDDTTVWTKGWKLEMGNKATPWVPRSTDDLYTKMKYDNNIEYDVSGFRNNATKVNLSYSSDTPLYNSSTFFADYTHTLQAPLVITPTAITMSCWAKGTSTGRGSYHMPLNIDGSHYEFSISSSGLFRNGFYINNTRSVVTTASKNCLDGEWHMLTATYDGTAIKRYVDGELINTVSVTGTLSTTTKLYVSTYGTDTTYGNVNLYESDIRIYTTPLSAADIQQLYKMGRTT